MTLQEWFDRDEAPTKSAFARMVGRSPQTITGLCKGRTRPSLSLAFRIAELTNGEVPASIWISTNGEDDGKTQS